MLHTLSIGELGLALVRKEISSVELARHFLARIERLNPGLNALITVTPERALAAAAEADRRRAAGEEGPLLGIPLIHKDIFCTDGVRTSCGSRMLDNFIAPYDATVVTRLEAAGAVMLGKANMDEFAMGSSNETSYYGPVKNPWDPRKVPGGSSGGSAAATAARLAPFATGTDTGGSIRQPAALTGITGIKPTYGRVSRYGMIAFASSLDQAGVFARTAADAAPVLQAMSGFDPRDSTSIDTPVPDYAATLEAPLKGLKIGLLREFFDGLEARNAALIRDAIEVYRGLGAETVEVSLPHLPLSVPTYYVVAPAECSSNLSRFDGVRFGYRCENPKDLTDLYERSRGEGFGPEVKRRIMTGTYVLSAGYFDAYYLKAQKVRRLITDEFRAAFAQVDLLIGPTTPTPAFDIGAKLEDPVTMYLNDIYTIGANLAGLPGMSLPCGFLDGLPMGLQLIGPHFSEAKLLKRGASVSTGDRLARPLAGWIRDMTDWEIVIGLEIHAQLATKSKIFSGSATAYGAPPNSQASLVDLAYPGVLPVLNAEAVRMAVKFGLSIHAEVARRSVFARKNYFYPDLPKGYQISQYELPVVKAGSLAIVLEDGTVKTIGVTRAHLEEDAGKSLHEGLAHASGIDLNRAGTPLLEIVSEPEMRSAKEAVAYMKKMHTLVRYLEICDGNMQEGSFRCDANVSVRPRGREKFGTRVEIKNLNSFRFVEKAIQYEAARQIELLESGGTVVQETRLYDSDKHETRSMRSKEEANDYRYFPDPDLLPVLIDEQFIEAVRSTLPELPDDKAARFARDFALSAYDAGVLSASRELGAYFEAVVANLGPAAVGGAAAGIPAASAQRDSGHAKLAANWVMGELSSALNRDNLEIGASRVTPEALSGLLLRIIDGTISGKIAKDVFEAMWSDGKPADAIIEAKGLKQITDSGAIEGVIDAVIAANPKQLADYRSGKDKLFGFFVGQVMKATEGKANPAQLNELLKRKLGGAA